MAGYFAIEAGWQGAVAGLAMIAVLALPWALLERREFNLPVHPVAPKTLQLPVAPAQKVFPVREVDTWAIMAAAALMAIANTTWSDPQSRLSLFYVGCILTILGILRLVEGRHTRLRILPTGLEVQALWYTLRIPWSAVECIEQRKYRWLLYYNSCEIQAHSIVIWWLKLKGFDRRIFLNKYVLNFSKSNLARAIFQNGGAKINVFSTEKS